mgnify:CR=1 FL=1
MSLNFDEIVSVAGKSGLYKVLKPTKTGYIVEELDNSKKKLVLGPNHRVSMLKEISIYTMDEEGSKPLRDIYLDFKTRFGKELPVSPKDDSEQLFDFLGDIIPNYDTEKVYHSDIKKLISWYQSLMEKDENMSFEEEAESKDEPEIDKPKKEEKKKKKEKKESKK